MVDQHNWIFVAILNMHVLHKVLLMTNNNKWLSNSSWSISELPLKLVSSERPVDGLTVLIEHRVCTEFSDFPPTPTKW